MTDRAKRGFCIFYKRPKIQYRARAVADFDAAMLRKAGGNVNVFRCDKCGTWHIGSKDS
jgi:hypothetical protein